VGRLKLEGFYAPIEAVEGSAGRTPWDPRLFGEFVIYAYSRESVQRGRLLAAAPMNQPSVALRAGRDQSPHVIRLSSGSRRELARAFCAGTGSAQWEGLVSLERVMHDGTRIKAFAGADSFRREERLKEHLEAARKTSRGDG